MSENIYNEIKTERIAQDEKWGGSEHDDQHEPNDFASFIADRVDIIIDDTGIIERQRRKFIQIAALAIAATESIDRLDSAAKQFHEGVIEEIENVSWLRRGKKLKSLKISNGI